MPLTVVTPSSSPAVDMTLLKKRLRLVVVNSSEYTAEDDVLSLLIEAATESFQEKNKTQLTKATLRWDFEGFKKKLELPRPPLMEVGEVAYLNADGNKTVVDAENYTVVNKISPGYIRFNDDYSFPDDIDPNQDYPVQVTYDAGYGEDLAKVPEGIQVYLMNLIGTYRMANENLLISYGAGLSVEDISKSMVPLISGRNKALRFG